MLKSPRDEPEDAVAVAALKALSFEDAVAGNKEKEGLSEGERSNLELQIKQPGPNGTTGAADHVKVAKKIL